MFKRPKITFGPVEFNRFYDKRQGPANDIVDKRIFYQSPNRIAELENLKRARKSGLGAKV